MTTNNAVNSNSSFVPVTKIAEGWDAAGVGFPVTDGVAVSPWTSNANLDTGNFDPLYFSGPHTPASTFHMAYNFGSMPKGVYKLSFSTLQGVGRPIITVTETNTSLAIGTYDTYYPGDTALVGPVEMYFNWAATGAMNIQFATPTKNASATDYELALVGIIELTQTVSLS